MAYFSLQTGDLKRARAIMDRKSWPGDSATATATEGLWYLASGDFGHGVTLYNRAMMLAASDLRPAIEQKKRLEMGKYYLQRGQTRHAVRELQHVVKIDSVERLSKLQANRLLENLTGDG